MNYPSSSSRLPVHQKPEERTMKRQHTVRYYVHRVHESLRSQLVKLVCAIFLSLLFIVGIITFILYISLKPHRPRFHIQEFNVPGSEAPKIGFSVTARNANLNIGIRYDAMEGSLFYRDEKIGTLPAVLPAFYQEPKNTKMVDGEFSGSALTVSSERWRQFMSDREKGTVIFRLELTSTIQFRISSWESKRHHVHANCDIHVGADGHILPTFKNAKCPVYFS